MRALFGRLNRGHLDTASLYINLQGVNFQRWRHVCTCPITQVSSRVCVHCPVGAHSTSGCVCVFTVKQPLSRVQQPDLDFLSPRCPEGLESSSGVAGTTVLFKVL